MEFVCQAKGKPLPTITWLRDEENATDDDLVEVQVTEGDQDTESRLIITEAQARHESPKYKVIAENSAGNVEREFGLIGELDIHTVTDVIGLLILDLHIVATVVSLWVMLNIC